MSVRLREATSAVHKEAEQRPFMKAFFAGRLPRDAYLAWLARQWHLYRVLERELQSLPGNSPRSSFVPPALYRTDRIAADLKHLTEGVWAEGEQLTDATAAYVRRIEDASVYPSRLLAHAWLRYMGNVGGRDVLRRLAAESLGIDADDSDALGLSWTDFSAVGEIRPFFAAFHAGLDALELTVEGQAVVVAEAEAGFCLNIALTDELAAEFGIL